MKTLIINTSDNKRIEIALEDGEKKYSLGKKVNRSEAQAALSLIDSLLKKRKLSIHDINKIKVDKSNGSFTGIRIGLSIANALSFALNISVEIVDLTKALK